MDVLLCMYEMWHSDASCQLCETGDLAAWQEKSLGLLPLVA